MGMGKMREKEVGKCMSSRQTTVPRESIAPYR